jgi:peptidoglycan biosynthesis protein MviN/MurJ (putative lipid II flippase)
LLRTESFRKGIVYSTAFNVAAKLISFANMVVIAAFFGTTATTDVYFYTVATVTSLSLFLVGFSEAVLIPEAVHRKEHFSEREAIGFLNLFLYLFFGISVLLTLLAMASPVRLFTTISHFDAGKLEAERSLLVLSLPLICLLSVNTYLKDCLSIYRYFTFPMAMSAVNSTLSILFIIAFHRLLSVKSITLGLLLGNVINFLLLLRTMTARLNWSFRVLSRPGGALLRRVGYAQAGNLTSFLSGYYPMYLLSGFGAGTIASLNFGKQIADAPFGFITAQFSGVSAMKFNELHARKEFKDLDRIYLQSTGFLVFMLIPISFFLFIFSRDLITILFRRGAFGAEGVESASIFLKLFAISIPLVGVNALSARAFMAALRTRETFWYQICSNVFLVGCLAILIKGMGVRAYPISFLMTYGLSLPLQFFMFRRFCPYIRYERVLLCYLSTVGINLVAAIPVYLIAAWLPHLPGILRVTGGFAVYAGIVIGINHLVKVNKDAEHFLRAALSLKLNGFITGAAP